MTTYTKVCCTCKLSKPAVDFNKHKRSKDGLQGKCRTCASEYAKGYLTANKEHLNSRSREYREANRDRLNKVSKEHGRANKEQKKEYNKAYREANKNLVRAQRTKYYENNKDQIKEYRSANRERFNEYHRRRRSTDPLFALIGRTRALIGQAFRKKGYTKKSRTCEILGCSYEEFKIHVESLFLEGMSWDNRDKWHIDHKIPVSWGTTEDEVIALNHYTNLKPMWAVDNWAKSNKYEG